MVVDIAWRKCSCAEVGITTAAFAVVVGEAGGAVEGGGGSRCGYGEAPLESGISLIEGQGGGAATQAESILCGIG